MRDIFSDYYRPAKEEYNRLWREGIFVLDTNVYLNLYRYSRDTREELLRLLRVLGNRLWAPHQVAAEFLNRRINVIHQQQQKLKEVRDHLVEVRKNVEERVHTIHRDPPVEPRALLEKLLAAFSDLEEYLNKQEENFTPGSNAIEDDEVWAAVEDLLNGKVGQAYGEERLKEIETEGGRRREKSIPPGFNDEGHGDLILWLQTIDKAKETGKPIILVTDDRKDDWWWKEHGRTVGPRRELTGEMQREAGNIFYMYTPDRFMKFAAESFDEQVSEEAISEAENFGISYRDTEASYLPEESLPPSVRNLILGILASGLSVEEVAHKTKIREADVARIFAEVQERPRHVPSLYREDRTARAAKKTVAEASPEEIEEALKFQQNDEEMSKLIGFLTYVKEDIRSSEPSVFDGTDMVTLLRSISRLKSGELSSIIKAIRTLRQLGLF